MPIFVDKLLFTLSSISASASGEIPFPSFGASAFGSIFTNEIPSSFVTLPIIPENAETREIAVLILARSAFSGTD